MHYLCYDLRGIQSFIFRVPRLAAIISGSAMVDKFDEEARTPPASEHSDVECVFAGGGKGAFKATQRESLDPLREALRKRAHDDGMDIRFGVAKDYSEAAHCADDLYAFLPEAGELTGHPCATSGLYSVKNPAETHPIIARLMEKGEGSRSRHFEQMLKASDLGPEVKGDDWEFFHDTEFAGLPKSPLAHADRSWHNARRGSSGQAFF